MARRYVDVICLNDKKGSLRPMYLIWDHTTKIRIDKVISVCPRTALRSGGSGLQYTCIIRNGALRHLFYDRGKWYVEMNDL